MELLSKTDCAEASVFPQLNPGAIAALADDIDRQGYGVIENCVRPDLIATLRRFVTAKVKAAGGETVNELGAAFLCPPIDELTANDAFRQVCMALYSRQNIGTPSRPDFHPSLRALCGTSGQKHSWLFHFDSFAVTALVPVLIPSEGRRGDLYLFPNMRRFRRHYLTNLFDKLVFTSRPAQRLIRWGIGRGWLKPKRVEMRPGNIYFFHGYRCLHANEPCDIDQVRATILLFYANPHEHSRLRVKLSRVPRPQPKM